MRQRSGHMALTLPRIRCNSHGSAAWTCPYALIFWPRSCPVGGDPLCIDFFDFCSEILKDWTSILGFNLSLFWVLLKILGLHEISEIIPKLQYSTLFLILICPSPCIICIRDQTTGKKQYFIYKPSRKMRYEIQNWCTLRGSSSMLKLAYGMLEPISFRFRDIPHYPQSSWTGVGGSLVTRLFSMSVR